MEWFFIGAVVGGLGMGLLDLWAADKIQQRAQDQKDELLDALGELVELKRIKDEQGKTVDYLVRQPKAWEHARHVLLKNL